ncbi:cytochrome ubiquinol oxidase subunit I [Paenibacillus melissococcoides]|uniref:Cytochrome ubiquinol oxidase subunit I n=1 Tax=Paenibacillus melissococcoides TaxID=2912268 RepID=A0ABN8U1B4_9BACL|nr:MULTISPECIES: cytochrome ubiquinol oxidase subunit I [Paenibacillus]MEB9892180.1 cytochrome ubiquinol oxidase subunit I [Bacillus cereus]CAH8244858.1 cytochrome ubiquinol oxidase subunit I [Paenibacillus melissococcoides]CAH8709186.1 cytochrome ubiquinol oxidase subunit I [Paenibacillus melissococcoides]CAH8709942.1 cytochrome ubiquinol oxidase subunit I [Paenibacillus melissococcoides]GIO81355.1 hypothetical protein J6TS7_49650 [Paenibacillus dendritiformis]
MDQVSLARIQFASTTLFHYIFVPMTIGLAFLIALLETFYVRTGKDIYKQSAQFWSKLFLINFAVGVVTGILQEFQFGMNWSNYSRFVGDVFGPSLAIEGLLAFFMESTFIGLWVFGWDRLSKRVHLACIWLVSIGTMLSAFWILTANAFMHAPVGYVFQNGRAEMSDFWPIIRNPQLWLQFPHTLFAALATGAFFMAGVSAWKLLKRHNPEMFRISFRVSITVALVSALLIAFIGHEQAQHLVKSQPMKMAAAEALWDTSEDPGVMRTEDAISPTVTAGELLFSLIAFTTIYGILAVIDACLFVKVIRQDGDEKPDELSRTCDPFGKEDAHAIAK